MLTNIDTLMSKLVQVAEELEKGFKDKTMQSQALSDSYRTSLLNKPNVVTPHKQTLPSMQEQADRHSTYSDFMPAGAFSGGARPPVRKNVNESYAPGENLAMNEKLSLHKNGQWSLEPAKKPKPEDKDSTKAKK